MSALHLHPDQRHAHSAPRAAHPLDGARFSWTILMGCPASESTLTIAITASSAAATLGPSSNTQATPLSSMHLPDTAWMLEDETTGLIHVALPGLLTATLAKAPSGMDLLYARSPLTRSLGCCAGACDRPRLELPTASPVASDRSFIN